MDDAQLDLKPSLDVDSLELRRAVRLLEKVVKNLATVDALLSFDGESLMIELGGATAAVAASGSWPGTARLRGSGLPGLADASRGQNSVQLSAHADGISAGSFKVSCVWQGAGTAEFWMPLNPSLPYLLWLGLHYGESEIKAGGAWQEVQNAAQRRDELVERAAQVLKPLEIDPPALREFIDQQVGRAFQ